MYFPCSVQTHVCCSCPPTLYFLKPGHLGQHNHLWSKVTHKPPQPVRFLLNGFVWFGDYHISGILYFFPCSARNDSLKFLSLITNKRMQPWACTWSLRFPGMTVVLFKNLAFEESPLVRVTYSVSVQSEVVFQPL